MHGRENDIIVRNLSNGLARILPRVAQNAYERAVINGDVTSGRNRGLICEINLR